MSATAKTSRPKDGLYHKLMGFPAGILDVFLNRSYRLFYSRHARLEILNDRYGIPTPPQTLAIAQDSIIEVEVREGRIQKLLVRIPYDVRRDLVLVIIPDAVEALVKTVWFNEKNDQHRTLRRQLYVRP